MTEQRPKYSTVHQRLSRPSELLMPRMSMILLKVSQQLFTVFCVGGFKFRHRLCKFS